MLSFDHAFAHIMTRFVIFSAQVSLLAGGVSLRTLFERDAAREKVLLYARRPGDAHVGSGVHVRGVGALAVLIRSDFD